MDNTTTNNRGGASQSDRSVRSFVFRRARLNKLHKSAIDRLSADYVLELTDGRDQCGTRDQPDGRDHAGTRDQSDTLEPADAGNARAADASFLFDRFGDRCSRRVLEIGFGMGYATAEYASANPDTCLLGSEVYPPGVGKLLSEIERRELSNVRIVRRDALDVLELGVRSNELDAVHVFFPDPWPKKKHHKRRLVQPSFLTLVADRLKPGDRLNPGGILYVTTDWDDYAEHIADVFDRHDAFVNVEPATDDPRRSVPRSWRPRTAFERKGLSKGHTVSEFYYRVEKPAASFTRSFSR